MPGFRSEEGFSNFSVVGTFQKGWNHISDVFVELSYTSRDAFVYDNYDTANFWYGANMKNLLLSPIPKVWAPWKPPVDDGMYLANAVIGYAVKPPAVDLPWNNSYPLSTPAGLFINFGVLGLIFGSVLLGWLYGWVFKILKDSGYDIIMIIIYQLIIYQFEISSLSIVQTLTPMVLLVLSTWMFFGWHIKLFKARHSA